jgi:hypothetical protein
LEHLGTGDHLVFVYRLDDGNSTKTFRLRNLDASATYQLTRHAAAGGQVQEHRGATLMDEGLRVELPQRYRAAVYAMRRTDSPSSPGAPE